MKTFFSIVAGIAAVWFLAGGGESLLIKLAEVFV